MRCQRQKVVCAIEAPCTERYTRWCERPAQTALPEFKNQQSASSRERTNSYFGGIEVAVAATVMDITPSPSNKKQFVPPDASGWQERYVHRKAPYGVP